MINDRLNTQEESLIKKKFWVAPAIQLISDNDIRSGTDTRNTENVSGGIYSASFGTNS
ncbi:MAG: hypothetical protein ACXVJD_16795 [Mucilaginibacter sp.]